MSGMKRFETEAVEALMESGQVADEAAATTLVRSATMPVLSALVFYYHIRNKNVDLKKKLAEAEADALQQEEYSRHMEKKCQNLSWDWHLLQSRIKRATEVLGGVSATEIEKAIYWKNL
jgi:hypothetical protein